MTHSLRSHYFHVIWSTRDRKDLISDDFHPRLYAYMGGIVRNHKGTLLKIGGTSNHVHLLIAMNTLDKFSYLIRDLKAKSSLWIHQQFPLHQRFAWQEGYGSFSVSHSAHKKVIEYIENQQQHHKVFSFEDEFLLLMKKHNIEYDNRFVF